MTKTPNQALATARADTDCASIADIWDKEKVAFREAGGKFYA